MKSRDLPYFVFIACIFLGGCNAGDSSQPPTLTPTPTVAPVAVPTATPPVHRATLPTSTPSQTVPVSPRFRGNAPTPTPRPVVIPRVYSPEELQVLIRTTIQDLGSKILNASSYSQLETMQDYLIGAKGGFRGQEQRTDMDVKAWQKMAESSKFQAALDVLREDAIDYQLDKIHEKAYEDNHVEHSMKSTATSADFQRLAEEAVGKAVAIVNSY